MKLKFTFTSKNQTIMKSRGVAGHCFSGARNSFDFDVAAVRSKPNIPGLKAQSVSVKRQIEALNRVLTNPLRGNPIIGIGGYPTDMRAKMIAVNIMDAAITYQTTVKTGKHARSQLPLWHRVYGGFKDDLRDSETDNPSMLIISNVCAESTGVKLEKVRDLLEKYQTIPRVVITSGCDPVFFFACKLHLPLDYCFYVASDNREQDVPSVLELLG